MSGPERRNHTRARAHNVVTYLSIGKKRVTAAIENISAGGVFLRSSLVAAAGTQIGLEFFEGDSKKTLSVTGTVVKVMEPGSGSRQQGVPGLGVKFDPLSFEQHRRMSSLIESIEEARPADPGPIAPPSAPKAEARAPAGPSGPGIKRRRNRRVPTRDATAHVRMKGDVVALSVPVSNVSMGGLFLQTTQSLPVGAALDVELTLAGQSMVISGQIVGEVAVKANRGLAPGVSMRFGPMPRRTADRLRQALAILAPLAADGLEQEILPGGYSAEAPAPAPEPIAIHPINARSSDSDFDFGAGELGSAAGDSLQTEDLRIELERLKAEVRLREERIAMIEKTLLELPRT